MNLGLFHCESCSGEVIKPGPRAEQRLQGGGLNRVIWVSDRTRPLGSAAKCLQMKQAVDQNRDQFSIFFLFVSTMARSSWRLLVSRPAGVQVRPLPKRRRNEEGKVLQGRQTAEVLQHALGRRQERLRRQGVRRENHQTVSADMASTHWAADSLPAPVGSLQATNKAQDRRTI